MHAGVGMNYWASPPLVVAYALAGTMGIDLESDAIGQDGEGRAVYLRDLWPSDSEITKVIETVLDRGMFVERYGSFLEGDERWRALPAPAGDPDAWEAEAAYIRPPPFLRAATGARRPARRIR